MQYYLCFWASAASASSVVQHMSFFADAIITLVPNEKNYSALKPTLDLGWHLGRRVD